MQLQILRSIRNQVRQKLKPQEDNKQNKPNITLAHSSASVSVSQKIVIGKHKWWQKCTRDLSGRVQEARTLNKNKAGSSQGKAVLNRKKIEKN